MWYVDFGHTTLKLLATTLQCYLLSVLQESLYSLLLTPCSLIHLGVSHHPLYNLSWTSHFRRSAFKAIKQQLDVIFAHLHLVTFTVPVFGAPTKQP